MTTYNQPKNLSDLLVTEVAKGWTVQMILLAPSKNALDIGTLLEFTDGQFKAITAQSHAVQAILAQAVPMSKQTQKVLAIVRGAVIKPSGLVFPEHIANDKKADLLKQLAGMGIVAEGAIFEPVLQGSNVSGSKPNTVHPEIS